MPGAPVYEPRTRPAPWMADAVCRGMDASVFFTERGANGDLAAAKAVCATCPVRVECLDHAIETRERWGVWGGKSERERRTLRRQRGLARQLPAQCGTNSGYESHRNRGETPCSLCRAARAAYSRSQRTRAVS